MDLHHIMIDIFMFFIFILDWHRVHGPVQSSGARLRRGTPGEDHWRVPRPVSVVWSGQETSVPSVDKAGGHGTSATAHLQVVPRWVPLSSSGFGYVAVVYNPSVLIVFLYDWTCLPGVNSKVDKPNYVVRCWFLICSCFIFQAYSIYYR